MSAAAIVAAAGAGNRAGTGDIPKQFRPLAGKPLLRWSVDVLRDVCDEVVVVAPRAHVDDARSMCGTDVKVVAGGPTRQVSVANGLSEVDTVHVIVHDAARPFVTKELVVAVITALDGVDAAIAAVPATDTLKDVQDARVRRTVERSSLWMAQTPQAFITAQLRRAHERAALDKIDFTDDAALIEHAGGSVAVVEGDLRNIKLTTAADFALAESIAASLQ
ncbi:MAG TPA: 2-C-methyl-D-erythritol 4-phosphate cytidylyltransferase [Actinomycetota bacterium]|nr:2-C-methyl-D-erythritol 4-phosphate cytidylyltransferase [Actinomycetota bacterium]